MSKNQITGKATIRVDGKTYKTMDGATITPGGISREAVKGDVVHGYKESIQEPTLDCKLAHTAEISLIALGKFTDATVEFETDTGVIIIMRESWTVEPPSMSGGEVDLKMAAMSADELNP